MAADLSEMDRRYVEETLWHEFRRGWSTAEARIAELERALRIVAQTHAWRAFGECRSFGADVPLLVPSEADLVAKAALRMVE
jgi:hypothetical protein